jgi:hypothetical protein
MTIMLLLLLLMLFHQPPQHIKGKHEHSKSGGNDLGKLRQHFEGGQWFHSQQQKWPFVNCCECKTAQLLKAMEFLNSCQNGTNAYIWSLWWKTVILHWNKQATFNNEITSHLIFKKLKTSLTDYPF